MSVASESTMSDALKAYQSKRDFARTSEPAGGGQAAAGALTFVVQKHWASRLHYDFRLELDGTMKSWAVPKGPSFDPHDKRMAVHVEDHPIAYSSFEGTIPEGQYGAGKVIIWDKGTWQPIGDPEEGYRSGQLKFELHGHKLRGKWALVRMKGRGEKQEPWLLIKEKDALARPGDEFSVVDEMPDSVGALPMPKPPAAGPGLRDRATACAAVKAALPATLAPQLATLVDAPPSTPGDWLFEVKFDGYRLLARIEGKAVRLFTRNGNDWTDKLGALHDELLALKLPDGWYDGEIVVHDDEGRPNFGLLQQAFDGSDTAPIVYFLFDMPYHDGADLRAVALETRRALLRGVLEKKTSETVHFSEEFEAPPEQLMDAACKLGLEGIIGKRRDSPYSSRRTRDWIKLKCGQRQEFVIGGYTDPQGARPGIGSLLLGVHDGGAALRYVGNVGTGFGDTVLRELKQQLHSLETPDNPFAPGAVADRHVHWVKPKLVAQVRFGEWTRAGVIRHSVFEGLRTDKPASAVTRETPRHVEQAGAKEPKAPAGRLPADFKLTHGERVVDAHSGVTKLELVRYYALVASLMMPHLKARPLALVRAPDGVGGQLFFQKHADVRKLPGVKQLDPALDTDNDAMLAIASEQGLLSAAQWNVIEFHTQNAIASNYDKPNRIVFDLDPGEGLAWRMMQETAQLLRAFLEELGLAPFLKTSGGKGLHVVVPIKPLRGWDTVKGFSQALVRHLADTLPDRFAFKSGPRNRVGKVFVDYLRNGKGATTASAWSARARPGLGISVPLDWDELAALKAGDQWNVRNVHQRLDRGNAPWAAYAKSARGIDAAMKRLGHSP
jgi:bifunctional non-homologous end joining protein LigD